MGKIDREKKIVIFVQKLIVYLNIVLKLNKKML